MADGAERLKIALHANGLQKSGNLQEMLDRLLSAGKPPGPVRKSIDKNKDKKKDGSIVRVIEAAIHGKICERLSSSKPSSAFNAALTTLVTELDVPPPNNLPVKGLAVLLADALLK